MGSSATVQIGLRLSNVNDMPSAAAAPYIPPYMQDRVPTPRPASSVYPQSMIAPASQGPLLDDAGSDHRDSVRVGSKVWVDPSKQLPPPPLRTQSKRKAPRVVERESQVLLSPTVYSPEGASNSGTAAMTSPSERDPRLSPWEGTSSAAEKRPSEWI